MGLGNFIVQLSKTSVMEERFYLCEVCNNLAILAIASGVTLECCGETMTQLQANEKEEGHEKHLPICCDISCHKMRIKVSSQPHPCTAEHHIVFICLETDKEMVIHYLEHEEVPEATIYFDGIPKAVYAYCNIHGLWKTEVKPDGGACSTR